MSYTTHVIGGFTITPPLTWPEFENSPFAPHNITSSYDPDIALRVTEEKVNTAEGPLMRRTATALVMREIDEYRERALVEHVQRAVTSFPGHEFSGYLECEGEENTDMWRVYVKDGRAVRVDPEIVWPEP